MSSSPAPALAARYKYLTDSYVFRWQNQTLRADLILTLPIALCLIVGIAIGHPAVGMIAAGGAMNTGFGKKQSIDDSSLLPMIFVTFGMAFAGFLGVMLGYHSVLLVFMVALWGFGYGMLTSRSSGYAWVGQQCVITLLVASAFPAPPLAAAARAALLFAGGVLQLILSSLLLHLSGELRTRLLQLKRYMVAEETALRQAVVETADSLWRRRSLDSAIPYALRLAFTLGLSTEIWRRLNYPSGYWIPITALVVLKPAVTDTVNRVIARMFGTVAGAILISFLLVHLHPGVIALAAMTILFAWLGYGLLNVNYALFTFTVTGYIVFLLSLNQLPGPEVAQHRAICTLIGAGIALCVRLAVISVYKRGWQKALHSLTPS
jgi:MFS family permease